MSVNALFFIVFGSFPLVILVFQPIDPWSETSETYHRRGSYPVVSSSRSRTAHQPRKSWKFLGFSKKILEISRIFLENPRNFQDFRG